MGFATFLGHTRGKGGIESLSSVSDHRLFFYCFIFFYFDQCYREFSSAKYRHIKKFKIIGSFRLGTNQTFEEIWPSFAHWYVPYRLYSLSLVELT